jgi:hypothetical protein
VLRWWPFEASQTWRGENRFRSRYARIELFENRFPALAAML